MPGPLATAGIAAGIGLASGFGHAAYQNWFDKTPSGKDTRKFLQEAYPGTTVYEQLGSPASGGVAGQKIGAQTRRQERRSAVALQQSQQAFESQLKQRELDTQMQVAEKTSLANVISALGPHSPEALSAGISALQGDPSRLPGYMGTFDLEYLKWFGLKGYTGYGMINKMESEIRNDQRLYTKLKAEFENLNANTQHILLGLSQLKAQIAESYSRARFYREHSALSASQRSLNEIDARLRHEINKANLRVSEWRPILDGIGAGSQLLGTITQGVGTLRRGPARGVSINYGGITDTYGGRRGISTPSGPTTTRPRKGFYESLYETSPYGY